MAEINKATLTEADIISKYLLPAIKAAGWDDLTQVRQEVKLHLCNSARAKDANIRQALIDRFGGKDKAIGRKTPAAIKTRRQFWQHNSKAMCWSLAVAWPVWWRPTSACKLANA